MSSFEQKIQEEAFGVHRSVGNSRYHYKFVEVVPLHFVLEVYKQDQEERKKQLQGIYDSLKYYYNTLSVPSASGPKIRKILLQFKGLVKEDEILEAFLGENKEE